MDNTSYCIACADMTSGVPLWLGCFQDKSGAYWCDVEGDAPKSGTMEFWTVVPLLGTDSVYLLNLNANQFATFSDGKAIALRPLDVHDPGFIIKLDDVGDGWVAINNTGKDQVFDAQTPAGPATPVIPYRWNGGANQMWKFVDANVVLGRS
jgi:hypothetical protein